MPRVRKPIPRPDPTAAEFADYVDDLPRTWGIWRWGRQLLPEFLALVEHEGLAVIDTAPDLDEVGSRARVWQDAMGLAVIWAHEYLHPQGRLRQVQPHDVKALIRRLAEFGPVRDLLTGVHAGLYDFDADGFDIRVYMRLDPGQEVVNRWLHEKRVRRSQRGAARTIGSVDLRGFDNIPAVGPRPAVPAWVVEQARSKATELVAEYPRLLPIDLQLSGFHLHELWAVWVELLAEAMVADMERSFRAEPFDDLPRGRREEWVVRLASRSDVPESSVESIVDFLTYRHGYHVDPALAPLIAAQDELIMVPSLVLSSSIERNVLRVAALDPSRFGPIGKTLGGLADEVAARFDAVPGVLKATRVGVRHEGRKVGDVDVLIAHPADRFACFIEVKWGIEPDSMKEMAKIETELRAGASQHARVRDRIAAGAELKLPPAWPDMTGWDQRWFVVTPDYVPTTPAALTADLPVAALRMFEELLVERGLADWQGRTWSARSAPAAVPSVRDLVDRWLAGLHPREGKHWVFQPAEVTIGRYHVHWNLMLTLTTPTQLFDDGSA